MSQKRIPLSTSFILPTVSITWKALNVEEGYVRSYLADDTIEGNVWGENIFLEMKNSITDRTVNYLVSNPNYVKHYLADNGNIMFQFSIPAKYRTSVVEPFSKGKYSQIDRDYVKANFQKFLSGGVQLSTNWMILHKHPSLKSYWEEQIGMDLPENAEVWSSPDIKDETYYGKTTEADYNDQQNI